MLNLLSGNSRILLTLGEQGQWAQLYYPYAGQFQHLQEARVGIWDEDLEAFEWLEGEDAPEPVEMGYIEDSNAARARHQRLGLDITVDDMVHPNLDLIIRRFTVKNPTERPKRVRLFHYQCLTIGGSLYQDTAYWDAERKTVNHYKRDYYFQLWGRPDFDAFTCGEHTLKGLKGSYVDAEDGQLAGNLISHGAADSVVQWNLELAAGQSRTLHLFVMIDRSRRAVNEFHKRLQNRDPNLFTSETIEYWNNWVDNKRILVAPDLSDRVRELYRRSLYVIRDCASSNGAIIASPDPRTLKSGGDTYNYNWWRDGAYICQTMDDVSMLRPAYQFLRFAKDCQEAEGYFLHRHFPDGSVGSTWHPPPFLQVDQTATVVDAAWHHFQRSGDLDELLELWPLVRQAADFMMAFTDERGLPKPSYDLWEEKKAVNAYSVAAVTRGLSAAARIGRQLGRRSEYWSDAAEKMRAAALEHLWNPRKNTFYKSLDPIDETIDASTLLTLRLKLLSPSDPRAALMVKAVEDRLWSKQTGGLARYEGDRYYGEENPWIICTLWLAESHLRLGNAERCRDLIEWAAKTASPTFMLAEQLDARSGQHTSVTPLVWSHSTFLDTVNQYTRYLTETRAKQRMTQAVEVRTKATP